MASRLVHTIKAVTQLGFSQILNYLVYQFFLRLGLFIFLTPIKSKNDKLDNTDFESKKFHFWPIPSDPVLKKSASKTKAEANHILDGKFLAFGISESFIDLSPKSALRHWSKKRIPNDISAENDIKFIWETARFSWAIKLSKAFYLTKDEKYVHFFWEKFEEFIKKNPLNLGPNWESAQEVALRLIALTISYDLMRDAKYLTDARKYTLLRTIADHANRIPPTLLYAKAQNNNHLISEAVGLYTAGTFLPNHPRAKKWRQLGLKWFDHAVLNQITENGEYIQYSTNYHRMMLMLALWMNVLIVANGSHFKSKTKEKIMLATKWLIGKVDQKSGEVPNSGHNDGSNILPFSSASYSDYRPILSSAGNAFLNRSVFNSTNQDELSTWLGFPETLRNHQPPSIQEQKVFKRLGNDGSWASMRTTHFTSRPAHADQLHVDLWHQGVAVTLDPGTFQYNAPSPWDNGLACTQVHNTITINEENQMVRGGRFLWLDWAQAKIIHQDENTICAQHDGYKRLNVVHERTLKRVTDKKWEIIDQINPVHPSIKSFDISLHWQLPDWPLKSEMTTIFLSAPFGKVELKITEPSGLNTVEVFKAGSATIQPDREQPLLGWYSPTYGIKIPAHSVVFSVKKQLPIIITSVFTFSYIN